MVSLVCVVLISVFFYLMVREDKAANINAKKLGACFAPCKSWRPTWKHGVLFTFVLSSFFVPSGLSFLGLPEDVSKEAWMLINVLILVMSLYSYCAFLKRKTAVQVLKMYLEQYQDLDKAVEFTNRACLDGDYFGMVLAKNNKSEINNV
jgi:hypothetical protein